MPRATRAPRQQDALRSKVRTVLTVPAGGGHQLAALLDAGRSLRVRSLGPDSADVVAGHAGRRPLATLPGALAAEMAAEYADDARWEVVRVWATNQTTVQATLQRVSPRHGRESTYRYGECRCDRCRADHAKKLEAWRARSSPPKPKREPKHGVGCLKRGCHCEVGKKAQRDRIAAYRARKKAEQAASAPASAAD